MVPGCVDGRTTTAPPCQQDLYPPSSVLLTLGWQGAFCLMVSFAFGDLPCPRAPLPLLPVGTEYCMGHQGIVFQTPLTALSIQGPCCHYLGLPVSVSL